MWMYIASPAVDSLSSSMPDTDVKAMFANEHSSWPNDRTMQKVSQEKKAEEIKSKN